MVMASATMIGEVEKRNEVKIGIMRPLMLFEEEIAFGDDEEYIISKGKMAHLLQS